MSGVLNSSLNGSATNITDSTGRSFSSSFSGQPGAGAPVFHHTGIQGLHNMHSNFNVPSMAGSLPSRNSSINGLPSGGMQQSSGNLLAGRFGSNNLSDSLSQISHAASHGHAGVANRGGMSIVGSTGYSNNTNVGGSLHGVLPTSAAAGNRGAVAGLGVSPMLGNAGSRITSSMGNVVGSGNIGRNMSSGGALSMPAIASRLNLTSNSGSGNSGLQGPNGLMGGVLQQASPQVMSMLGNSYASGGNLLSQNHAQAVNNLSSRAMLHDMNPNDTSPFGMDDFPSLASRPNSAGAPQGQIGSMRKQGFGGPIGQRNQEFSIQSEDFPALPGFKGGSVDFGMDFRQKDQLQDNNVSMMQSQHFSMGRSAGFTLGGTYSSHQPQHQQQHMPSVSGSSDSFTPINNQRLLQSHGSDMLSSNSTFHVQGNRPSDNSLRSVNNLSSISSVGSYDQRLQQYQQQNPSQFHLRQMPAMNQAFRDQGVKSIQATQAAPDSFGLLGLLGVISMTDPDLTALALGIDLTTLGLNLNSSEDLHKSFGSPWSDEPAMGDPEFVVPKCYHEKPAPPLQYLHFLKLPLDSLFYIFYSMPKDEAQLYAAFELHRRHWLYHKELRLWLTRNPNVEPHVKTQTYERGSYKCFDPNTWREIQKDNFVLQYELLEKKPALHQHH